MKLHVLYCATIFTVVAVIAGAFSIAHIYGPPRNAADICAMYQEARGSAFCVEIGRAGGSR